MGVDRTRLPEVGVDPVFRFPEIVRHRLANGLEVRTIEHRTVPVVTMVAQIEGGSGADPAGREGLAAITAEGRRRASCTPSRCTARGSR